MIDKWTDRWRGGAGRQNRQIQEQIDKIIQIEGKIDKTDT